jgi:hypothetical protein
MEKIESTLGAVFGRVEVSFFDPNFQKGALFTPLKT